MQKINRNIMYASVAVLSMISFLLIGSDGINKEVGNSCLLIIDVQKGFLNENTNEIPEKVEKLQHKYVYVLITKFYNPKDSFYRKIIKWNKFDKNSEDTKLAFTPRADAMILEKGKYSCVNTVLLDFFKSKDIKIVHICGINTNICVTKNAVDLIENGITPVVLSDYCASQYGIESHIEALKNLRLFVGDELVK